MKKQWILILCFISSSSLADQFLCATNMQYVYTGDSMNSVIATCGQPDQMVTEAPPAAKNQGGNLAWYYRYQPLSMLGALANDPTMPRSPSGVVVQNAQALAAGSSGASSPISLAIIFSNGQVSSIQQRSSVMSNSPAGDASTSGQEIPSYTCLHGAVQVGASMNDVANACGLPIFQRTIGQATVPQNQNNEATVASTLLVYKPQTYLPAQTLVFKGGLLVGQK